MSLLSHKRGVSHGARSAAPLTVDEIDAHPDCDRIWATILQLRDETSRQLDCDYPGGLETGRE